MIGSAEIDRLGWEAMAKAQPTGSLPAWILFNATSHKEELRKDLWELSICFFGKRELQPCESWETQPDGLRMFVRTDPTSGEKLITLFYHPGDDARVDLFRVEVDLQTKQVTVRKSVEVGDLDPECFDLSYEMDHNLQWPGANLSFLARQAGNR